VARLTRKELKKDPFLSVYYDDFVEFAQKHYQKIIVVVIAIAVIVFAVTAWKHHEQQQEVSANALLGAALATFHAYVGQASQDALGPGVQAFPTAADKYKAALKEFSAVVEKYPRQKAAEIALYHIGICQAQLGQDQAAVKTLQEASHASDRNIASLAQFALADELARSGKLPEAEKIYRQLAEQPTATVPAPTAWLALADLCRTKEPAQARAIYERVAKEYGSNAYVAETVKQQLATLQR